MCIHIYIYICMYIYIYIYIYIYTYYLQAQLRPLLAPDGVGRLRADFRYGQLIYDKCYNISNFNRPKRWMVLIRKQYVKYMTNVICPRGLPLRSISIIIITMITIMTMIIIMITIIIATINVIITTNSNNSNSTIVVM